ncbi:hypothetical protein ABKN59_001388 [Abortiporus biennis]
MCVDLHPQLLETCRTVVHRIRPKVLGVRFSLAAQRIDTAMAGFSRLFAYPGLSHLTLYLWRLSYETFLSDLELLDRRILESLLRPETETTLSYLRLEILWPWNFKLREHMCCEDSEDVAAVIANSVPSLKHIVMKTELLHFDDKETISRGWKVVANSDGVDWKLQELTEVEIEGLHQVYGIDTGPIQPSF